MTQSHPDVKKIAAKCSQRLYLVYSESARHKHQGFCQIVESQETANNLEARLRGKKQSIKISIKHDKVRPHTQSKILKTISGKDLQEMEDGAGQSFQGIEDDVDQSHSERLKSQIMSHKWFQHQKYSIPRDISTDRWKAESHDVHIIKTDQDMVSKAGKAEQKKQTRQNPAIWTSDSRAF